MSQLNQGITPQDVNSHVRSFIDGIISEIHNGRITNHDDFSNEIDRFWPDENLAGTRASLNFWNRAGGRGDLTQFDGGLFYRPFVWRERMPSFIMAQDINKAYDELSVSQKILFNARAAEIDPANPRHRRPQIQDQQQSPHGLGQEPGVE